MTEPAPLSECTCGPGGPDDIRHDEGCPCRVSISPVIGRNPLDLMREDHVAAKEKIERMPQAAAEWLREHADDLGLDPEGAAEAADELARAVADA